MGIILFELIFGDVPFKNQDKKTLKRLITKGTLVIDDDLMSTAEKRFHKDFINNALKFIRDVLVVNKSARLDFSDANIISNHQFFHGFNWQEFIDLKSFGKFRADFLNPFSEQKFVQKEFNFELACTSSRDYSDLFPLMRIYLGDEKKFIRGINKPFFDNSDL